MVCFWGTLFSWELPYWPGSRTYPNVAPTLSSLTTALAPVTPTWPKSLDLELYTLYLHTAIWRISVTNF